MTGNKSYLLDYEEIIGGFVAFGGDLKGGRITGKGKISTSKLDFEDVYFVKELKFNLFSVSQMCDKKNSVLFTDTERVVLSHDFKLLDENHVLLRVPRKDKMYSVDLKNIGIKRKFSVARTPQQYGGAERKNRTLIEAARTMLADFKLPITFWAEAVNTACYVQTRVLVIKPHNKTPYELFLGRKHALSFMRPFRCLVTILNTLDHLGYGPNCSKDFPNAGFKPSREEENMDSKHLENKDSEIPNTKEPRVHQEQDANVNSTNNINTVIPIVNVADIENNVVDENIVYGCIDDPSMPNLEEIVYSDDDNEEIGAEDDMNNLATTMPVSSIPTTRVHKDHPLEQIIRDIHPTPQTRSMTKNVTEHGITKSDQALTNPSWIEAMQDELLQFKLQKIDVKSAFLYGTIEEEVYVCQPLGFEDPEFPNKVYKVEKALYGLHQAPRAWYETLSTYLLENGFRRGTIDKTLFIKKDKDDILLVLYDAQEIPDEFYGGAHFLLRVAAITPIETNKVLLKDEEATDVDVHLYRLMIGSLMYLIASRPDIMFAVCAFARFQVTLKTSHLHAVKRIFRYLKGHPKFGLWYPRDSPVNLEAFSDSDYAGASLDRKSTTRGCGKDDGNGLPLTTSSLKQEGQWCQDTILGVQKLKFDLRLHLNKSYDPPLSRVNTLGSGEDSMKLKELMEFCTKLSVRALDV
ncbi:putative ribonuclease H-like domain-containing protein [Tanacetum coccineum]